MMRNVRIISTGVSVAGGVPFTSPAGIGATRRIISKLFPIEKRGRMHRVQEAPMHPPDSPRFCSEPGCELRPHIENCKSCYGWGLFMGEREPNPLHATAVELLRERPDAGIVLLVCPACHSDLFGPPGVAQGLDIVERLGLPSRVEKQWWWALEYSGFKMLHPAYVAGYHHWLRENGDAGLDGFTLEILRRLE